MPADRGLGAFTAWRSMKIAIVGCGAAGMVTAYLLNGRHELTLFESQSVLGGHVRTLHGNVRCDSLDDALVLDAGVIEFDEGKFRNFHRLLDELEIERLEAPGTTALYLADGRHYRSLGDVERAGLGPFDRLREYAKLVPLGLAQRRFWRRTADLTVDSLYPRAIDEFLGEDAHSTWLRMLLMYAYSMHYPDTAGIPAALAVPMLRSFTSDNRWTAIKGGSYTYLQRIRESLAATIHLDAAHPPGSRARRTACR